MTDPMPTSQPALLKQPSDPILIGGRAAASSRHAKAPKRSKGRVLPHSVPPNMKFQPPRAPTLRPRVPDAEPQPLELPPSPPLFSEIDVQKEMARRQAEDQAHLKLQPMSRSLNDYAWQAYSMPSSFTSFQFAPTFDGIQEAGEDGRPEDSPSDQKSIDASSFSESSTIFSMLKESTSVGAASHAPVGSLDVPGTDNRRTSEHDPVDDLQFSISLDPHEESLMSDEHSTSQPSAFQLGFTY